MACVMRTETTRTRSEKGTHQLRVSGLMVFSRERCFAHVLQLAFSRRTPLAISLLCFVMAFQLVHTSSSVQSWERYCGKSI
jgi:hypothetical protein